MMVQTKLVRDGNSWSIRLPKSTLQASGFKPGTKLLLMIKSGQIIIYSEARAKKLAGKDSHQLAKQDAREAWDEAFEQVWLEIFGSEE